MPKTLTLLSSGSGGEPKKISRPAESWTESIFRETEVFRLTQDECYVVVADSRHSLWSYTKFRATTNKNPFIGISRINSRSLKVLSQNNPTVLYSIPQLASLCIRAMARNSRTAPTLRRLLLGGAALPSKFPWELQKRVFPNAEVWMFYGSAETSFIGYGKPGAPYKLFPDVAIKIDENERLWVKSPMTINTKEWVNTDDLAVMTPGGLQLIGRAQRQVSSQGRNFSVEPVESLLENSFDIEKAALLQSQTDMLFCVLMTNSQKTSSASSLITTEALNSVIQASFMNFPSVKQCYYLEANRWPLTNSGKTDWRALQEIVDSHTS